MTKVQLAERLAEALNLLDNLRMDMGETTTKQANAWWHIMARLPEAVQENLRNNGTVKAKELL